MRRLASLLLAVLAPGCEKAPEEPRCGLHSASAPVRSVGGTRERGVLVGARLLPSERIKADGPALLECFGGALHPLEKGDAVTIGELKAARIEAITVPKYVLKDRRPVKVEDPPLPMVVARYSDNLFTPVGSAGSNEPTTGDYFRAFFTPNGIENMGAGPRSEGPSRLPPPMGRPKVPRIHAGELGVAGHMLSVKDDWVFAETDGLATAVLLEGNYYDLGQTVRLILPDGAEAMLGYEGTRVTLEGPMDLRLK